jgi:hypothetical protein
VPEAQIKVASTPGAAAEGALGVVLELVEETVERRGAGDAVTAAAEQALSCRGLVEVLLVTGHYYGLAMLMNTVELDPDPPLGSDVIESVRNRKL